MPKAKNTEAADTEADAPASAADTTDAPDTAGDEAVSESDTNVVCGRCGKAFDEDQIDKGVNCTHRACPLNV